MELKDKVALVTGASRGIGAATAKLLARKGAKVGVNYLGNAAGARAVVEQICAAGGQATALQADVSDRRQVEEMVRQLVVAYGRLDVLVNNAGGPAPGSIETVTVEAWHRAFAVHLDGPFFCIQVAVPLMKKQGEGAIVNISSVAGLRGCAGIVAYQTVKGAIQAFTRGLARDLAEYKIRVNCVSPGIVRTDFHAAMSEAQKKINLDQRIPLHKEGHPDQIAQAILLLVTNDYMTGENVTVDAGLTMRIA